MVKEKMSLSDIINYLNGKIRRTDIYLIAFLSVGISLLSIIIASLSNIEKAPNPNNIFYGIYLLLGFIFILFIFSLWIAISPWSENNKAKKILKEIIRSEYGVDPEELRRKIISNGENMWEKFLKRDNVSSLDYRNTDLSRVNDETLDIIYKECKNQLEVQYQSIQSILNRSGILVGFIGLIFATILSLVNDSQTLFFYLGIVSLGISFFIALIAWYPKKYGISPNPYNLYNELIFEDHKFAKDLLSDIFGIEHKKNKKIIDTKNLMLKISSIFLFVGIILIVINAMYGA